MKYANGIVMNGNQGQVRAVVCAKTKKRMIELLKDFHITNYRFRDYWNQGVIAEFRATIQDKEGVWLGKDLLGMDLKKYEGKT